MLLVAGRPVLVDPHIVGPVLHPVQAVAPGKADAVVADGLCIARAVGNTAKFFKIIHHPLGMKCSQHTLFHADAS